MNRNIVLACLLGLALIFIAVSGVFDKRSITSNVAPPVATATNEVQAVIYTVPTEEEALHADAAKWCELRISEMTFQSRNRDLYEQYLKSIRDHQNDQSQPLNIDNSTILTFANAWRELERGGEEALQKHREQSALIDFPDYGSHEYRRRRENRR